MNKEVKKGMSEYKINIEAENLSSNLVNFEGNLWKRDDKGIWSNTTDGAGAQEFNFAVRNQVKQHLPYDVKLNDIDKVKKELSTILTAQKYSLTNIKPALRFANRKMWYDFKNNMFQSTTDVDFSPFQMKRDIPQDDIDRSRAKEYVKFIENITGGDRNKENAIYEFVGFTLAGEHSGAALVIEGESGIGKTTLAKMINIAIKNENNDETILDLKSKDIYSNKGDSFAFANGVEKPLWIVGEGGNVFEEDAVKQFNDLIDETRATFSIRKMNQAPTNAPKFFNMLLLTNGGFSVHSNPETMKAFKKRLVIIESPAKRGILTLSELDKIFGGDNMHYFIQEAIRGYVRAKLTNKPRAAKFTETKVLDFWNNNNDNLKFDKIIEEHQAFGPMWKAAQVEYFTNADIEDMIDCYKVNHKSFSNKYGVKAFKNELLNAFEAGLLPELDEVNKRKSKKVNGKVVKPLSFMWK